MNFKRSLTIILAILAIPCINATGGEFSIYSSQTEKHAETLVQFSHGFYSSVQFLPHQVVRNGYGIYGVINNTVFMLSLNKSYEFLNKDIDDSDVLQVDSIQHVSRINIAQLSSDQHTIYMKKRLNNEKIENIQFQGQLGFW
ncbi:hypothetical protein FB440_12823 [Vibrio crassostreae]|uniref:hypothetical protein n=1 Tax=Vibrio crassostreae TaxID=246167 RepID=UPI0010513F9D|nr:hypothetical protein [Vibrio crassostreae]TCV24945.1 hypothetical protein EDB71_11031 [Vibrio crassostreae]TWD31595.1 hypothetical protein FB440_12823 [Vibrio crassostreae]